MAENVATGTGLEVAYQIPQLNYSIMIALKFFRVVSKVLFQRRMDCFFKEEEQEEKEEDGRRGRKKKGKKEEEEEEGGGWRRRR